MLQSTINKEVHNERYNEQKCVQTAKTAYYWGKKKKRIKANTNIEKKILTGIEIILIRTANWECSTDNVPPLRRKLLPTRERGKLVPVCV